jgi:hypothetical protein
MIAHLDRVDAELVGLATTFEVVLTEVLRLQSFGDESVRSNVDALLKTLQKEERNLIIFEQPGISDELNN